MNLRLRLLSILFTTNRIITLFFSPVKPKQAGQTSTVLSDLPYFLLSIVSASNHEV